MIDKKNLFILLLFFFSLVFMATTIIISSIALNKEYAALYFNLFPVLSVISAILSLGCIVYACIISKKVIRILLIVGSSALTIYLVILNISIFAYSDNIRKEKEEVLEQISSLREKINSPSDFFDGLNVDDYSFYFTDNYDSDSSENIWGDSFKDNELQLKNIICGIEFNYFNSFNDNYDINNTYTRNEMHRIIKGQKSILFNKGIFYSQYNNDTQLIISENGIAEYIKRTKSADKYYSYNICIVFEFDEAGFDPIYHMANELMAEQ